MANPNDSTEPAAPTGAVQVVSPLGTVGYVPADQAARAQAQGYRLASSEEIKAERNQREYGGLGHAVLAGLSGLARGATAGLSDVALAGLGGEDVRQALDAYEEVHPGISTVSEIGGAVGGAFVSGGASAAGEGAGLATQAARAISLPTRAIMGLGEATESLVGRYLTTKLALPQVARAAIEGGASELGHAIGQSYVHDTELTGEKIAAALGTGALMGGGVGLGVAGVTKALSSTAGLVRRAISSPTASSVQGAIQRSLGTAAPGIGRDVSMFAKASSVVSGAERNAIHDLTRIDAMGRAAREEAFNAAEKLATHGDELATALGDAVKARNAAANAFTGVHKADTVGTMIKRGNELETIAASRDAVSTLRTEVEDMLGRKGEFGHLKDLKEVRKRLDVAEKRIDAAAQRGDNGELFMELDDLKRDIGKATTSAAGKRVPTSADAASFGWLESTYEKRLLPLLENEDLWGDAASAQSRVNAPWSDHIQVARNTNGLFKSEATGKWGRKTLTLNREKIGSLIEGLTNPNKAAGVVGVEKWLATAEGFTKSIGDLSALSAVEREAVQKMAASAAKARQVLTAAKDTGARAAQLEALRTASGGAMTGGLLAGAASAIGGPVGIAASTAVGALASPYGVASKLWAIERLAQQVDRRMSGGLSKTFDRATKQIVYAPQYALRPVVHAVEEQNVRAKRYEKRAQTARDMLATAAAEQVRTTLGPLHGSAPRSVGAAVDASQRAALAVARITLPKGVAAAPSEVGRAERVAKVVDDPSHVARAMAGHALTPEDIDTMRTVYPRLYEDVRTKAVQRVNDLADKGKQLPHADRVQVSMLVGQPVDHTMIPSVLRAIQAGYDAPQQTQRPSQPQGHVPDLASAFRTESEKIAKGVER